VSVSLTDESRRLLASHLTWPTALFVLVAGSLALLDADPQIAASWAYHPSTGWLAGRVPSWVSWWLHEGGRGAVALIAGMAGAGWLLGVVSADSSIARWRGALGWAAVSIALSALLIGGLKQITNVDCPADLIGFGGSRPYLGVFRLRPPQMPHAVCFPGAHAGSGFSLFAFYFAFREHSRTLARWLFALAVLAGTGFALIQEARGAHFLSHDVWSAYLAWVVALGVCIARRERLPSAAGNRARVATESAGEALVGDVGA
jgi:membrane-associated PAP2 superfamily phosphatase